MSIFGIVGVEIDARDCVVRAVVRKIDPKRNAWDGSPSVLEAHQIASLIVKGDMVLAIFARDNQTVSGPKFKRVVYPGGAEGIELEEEQCGRTVRDLVQHVSG